MKKKISYEIIIGILLVILGIGSAITAYILNFGKNAFSKGEWYIYLLYILGAVFIFIGACLLYRDYEIRKDVSNKINVRQMTLIAFQASITIILYYYAKFNLPFFPGWLDIQVSEIPALITSFIYGPGAGAMVIFIRFLVKLPGTMTVGVGEFADLILGLSLVLISGIIYKKKHTFKGALLGLGIGVIVSTFLACILNWLVLIPAYINIAGFKIEQLIGMMSYIPSVTKDNFMLIYIFVGVLPFNLFRYVIVLALTIILYKKTHVVFDKIARR